MSQTIPSVSDLLGSTAILFILNYSRLRRNSRGGEFVDYDELRDELRNAVGERSMVKIWYSENRIAGVGG